jgi:hypothetical protein
VFGQFDLDRVAAIVSTLKGRGDLKLAYNTMHMKSAFLPLRLRLQSVRIVIPRLLFQNAILHCLCNQFSDFLSFKRVKIAFAAFLIFSNASRVTIAGMMKRRN